MTSSASFAGPTRSAEGRFLQTDGRWLYEIRRLDSMAPFLLTLVGDTDLWMFLSSSGALTAGRVDVDRRLFPYETDDRLHEMAGLAGPVTMVRFEDGRLWRPLQPRRPGAGVIRAMRRSLTADSVEFEETDARSGLTFCAELGLSDALGVVRRCELRASPGAAPIQCELIDGYVNVQPAGVPLGLQQSMSTLVDGYKRSERIAERGPAIYALESMISDRPEAIESLRANAIWHVGLDGAAVSLSESALEAFEQGEPPGPEDPALGQRGAYLCRTVLDLAPGARQRWYIVGDVHLDHSAIVRIRRMLESGADLFELVDRSLEQDRERLDRLLDGADGAQATADIAACAAHRSNVLFNAMRGGVPLNDYQVEPESFRRFVHDRHAGIGARHDAFLAGLEGVLNVQTLPEIIGAAGDPQLVRLAHEYLPLTFGRRHGDPSRPWNRFRIKVRDERGARIVGYEGNWRDIFQNWEAMARSYPGLLPGMIAKFVNASTVDGHNPYRINERGVDWEAPGPEDRSNIGYWGDHQIIYLLRLLEQCRDTLPQWLPGVLEQPIFSYANVPYRIRSFQEIARNPRDSIRFDDDLHRDLEASSAEIGGDGRLVLDADGEPALVTLLEKLLVTALAKVCNLVPGGGVWMNTMRPEWNDANNALAGWGLSMVTLYQLRRFCDFAAGLIDELGDGVTLVSAAVAEWRQRAVAAMTALADLMQRRGAVDDAARRRWLADVGSAAEAARESLYADGPGQPVTISRSDAADFFRCARDLCDDSIRNARRPDGLYQSYNVLSLTETGAAVDQLGLMLEGQVAALSGGILDMEASCGVLDALFRSELYRADQRSFMLYPRVDLPRFMDRNVICADAIDRIPLFRRAAERPEAGILAIDADGRARFCAELNSHEALQKRLTALAGQSGWSELVRADAAAVHDAFERTFRHAQFTGRAGRMHKYEGLGSVYWHMVSKLLLATQEIILRASDEGAGPELIARLRDHYGAIRDGLGFRKTPAEFGAVPHEPYSHTPWAGGAQQPGMTGQVKEGVLARFAELGVRVQAGRVRFDPVLVDPAELLDEPARMRVAGQPERLIDVPAGAVGLTLCGVPIIVRLSDRSRIAAHCHDGAVTQLDGSELSRELSCELFRRTGRIELIEVELQRTASPEP
ncbi:MAG: hypothetical protein ACF8R7_12280 [Phycisphaerales bacterium JB039]